MSGLSLIERSFQDGVWTGELSASHTISAPDLVALHNGSTTTGLRLTARAGTKNTWDVEFDLPRAALSEGTQVFLITDNTDGDVLHRLTIIAGHPATEDLRAEVHALRAELDQLRAAFRAEMRARTPS
ncbi:hypothetical protein [Tropicimonas sp. S265A]|uniref:hypothetical protein n=1 Tax=Tropicimonas sp. S265A TaxID=3415134 RepID=UPI003C7B04CC